MIWRRLKVLFLCSFALLGFDPSRASERLLTGNDVLASCRLAAELKFGRNIAEAYKTGDCAGKIYALIAVGSYLQPNMRICFPGDAIMLQGPKVVVRFMETHPERLHEPAIILFIDALRSAWPCSGNIN